MESIPSSLTTSSRSGGFPELESLPDWRKLRKAIGEPVKEIILAEIDTPTRAYQLIDELGKTFPRRLQRTIEFDAQRHAPDQLLTDCASKAQELPPNVGTIFLIDVSQTFLERDQSQLVAFWQGMNMLRERWDHLDAQTVLFVQSTNYRLLSSHADHLKRWIPVKIHLVQKVLSEFVSGRELLEIRRQANALPNARQSLEVLETQLTTALHRGESPSTFATRYYIPMFVAAMDAGKFDRAVDLHKKLVGVQVPSVLFPDWSRSITAFHAERGNLGEATRAAEFYLKWARQTSRKYDEAAACFLFGMIWTVRKQPREAAVWLRKSLDLFQQIGATEQIARVYGQLGIVAKQQGEFEEAESWCQQAFKLAEEAGDQHAMTITLQHLGVLAAERGRFEESEHWLLRALSKARSIQNQDLAASSLHNLAVLAKKNGDEPKMEMWRRKFLETSEASAA